MSKHSARPVSRGRRALAFVGVLGVAGGASLVGVAAMAPGASAATSTFNYACQVTNQGLERTFTDPWSVTMTADVPASVEPGAAIPAPAITAKVTTGADAADQLRGLQVKTIEGTAAATYTFGDAARTVDLTIPKVSVPAQGGIVTNAEGTGQAETAPSTAGTVSVKAGAFTTTQTTDSGFILHISCTPAAGADMTIATITVGAPAPTTSTAPTTTEPTTPAPTSPTTSTEPTTPEPTSPTTSTEPTTPEPTSPTTSTEPTTPEPTTPEPTSPTTSTEPTTPEPTSPSTSTEPTSPTTSTEPTSPTTSTSTSPTTSTEPSTTDPTQPSETHSPTTSHESTASATSSETSATAAPSPTTDTTQGPKVETDRVASGSLNLAGVTLAAAGVVALGGAAFAGRREN